MRFLRPPILEFTVLDDCSISIYVVDADASVRDSLKMLFLSAGMKAITFESAEALLASDIGKRGAGILNIINDTFMSLIDCVWFIM